MKRPAPHPAHIFGEPTVPFGVLLLAMTTLRSAYLYMLLSAASFSVMSFLTHELRHSLNWQAIALVRTGIALALVIALARGAGVHLVMFRPGTLWIRSLAGSVALLANFYSMTHYPISEVLALSNMFPLWVAVLSWPVLGERTRPDVWLAAGIGVVGVYFLQQRPAIAAAETDFGVLPVITAVTASLASAIAMLGLHKLKGVDTRAIVAHFSGVSMACSALALCFMATPMVTTSLTVPTLILLGVVGVSATAGQILLTKAFASGPPAQVSVIGLSQVAFSMTLETVFHGRTFSSTTLLGLALVVLPTAWVLTRKTTSPAAAHCESEASPESAEAMEAISDV